MHRLASAGPWCADVARRAMAPSATLVGGAPTWRGGAPWVPAPEYAYGDGAERPAGPGPEWRRDGLSQFELDVIAEYEQYDAPHVAAARCDPAFVDEDPRDDVLPRVHLRCHLTAP